MGRFHPARQIGDNHLGNFVLHREHVLELAVIALGPEMMSVGRIDQLNRNAHPIARFAHTALDDIAHAKFAAHLHDVGRLALVNEGGIARDHEQIVIARQLGDDVFGHAVDEILLFLVAAHIVERKNGDGRSGLSGDGAFRRGRGWGHIQRR